VSLGAQSVDDAKLALLERDHRLRDVEAALERCRPAFSSLAVDLIFGVPGETREIWRADLDFARAAAIDHVSTYGLTFERGTPFWSRRLRGELTPLGEPAEAELYEMALDQLVAAGFAHYEVSNFARAGHRCRHNETYWLGGSYFAAGPGAARYLGGRRELNHRSTTTYLKRVLAGQSPAAEAEQLSPEDAARERLVFGLRRMEGVDRHEFARQMGWELETLVGPPLARFVAQQLLAWDGPRLRLTRAGLLVSDALWPEFLRA
jgi:oxygen-independent coproporphyrinogen-3 oxidase